jgi:phosphate transport system protein
VSGKTKSLHERLDDLKRKLEEQGALVAGVVETAVEAVFEKSTEKARGVVARDEVVDRVDVQIEKDAVRLLQDAVAADAGAFAENEIRLILTVVKVNNELERVADLAVAIAEEVASLRALPEETPAKFRVMANSIIGIVQNTNTAFAHLDVDAATLVLASDDATEAFKRAILRDVEEALVAGEQSVDFAFSLHTIAAALARIGDHCTNVAEQVIYVETGKIVRHMGEKWTEPTTPD